LFGASDSGKNCGAISSQQFAGRVPSVVTTAGAMKVLATGQAPLQAGNVQPHTGG